MIIVVVIEDLFDCFDEIYDFFVSLNLIGVGFNIEEIEGVNNVFLLFGEEVEFRVCNFFYCIYE